MDHIVIDNTMSIQEQILQISRAARAAARFVVSVDSSVRKTMLLGMAEGIVQQTDTILTANACDMKAGHTAGLSPAMLDRLMLDQNRISAMAEGVRQIAELNDPVGTVLRETTRPNGLIIRKVRVPLGVIAMIYESRPNVTADAAALCLKAGNAVILRGGSEATHSNRAILNAMLQANDIPINAVQLIPTQDRNAVHELLQMDQYIDLIIPRGGESLIRAVAEHSRIPVLKHYKGVCHVYVDRAADLNMAKEIIMNGKCQRPGVCNAIETLLVHADVAETFLPITAEALIDHGVELRGDERTRQLVSQAIPATEDDWAAEYLDLRLAVRVVDDIDTAIDHIETYGSNHTDVIVTANQTAADQFTRDVNSAVVFVNASSRFNDGFEFGLGAEIGISTDKLHARGPCGVEELTTYQYVCIGSGQVRQ